MDFELFRQEVKAEVFDYQILAKHLRFLKKPRDKVASLIVEGKIIRLKKGLYVFGEQWRRSPIALEVVANLLYGPSCISFEYALARYGLMSERSVVITSLTLGKSKTFQTPIGEFEYRAVTKEKFKVGLEYRNLEEEGGYLIASKEKALVDLVYRTSGIRTIQQLHYYLFEEMRIDEGMFRELDVHKLRELGTAYKKRSVSMMDKL